MEKTDIISTKKNDLRLLASMLSYNTHAVNNSLAIIVGQASIMELLNSQNKLTPEKSMAIIEKIKKGSEQMMERMQNFRDFYKILNESDSSSLGVIVNSAYNLHMSFLDKKGISIDYKVPETSLQVSSEQVITSFMVIDELIRIATSVLSEGAISLSCSNNSVKVEINSPNDTASLTATDFLNTLGPVTGTEFSIDKGGKTLTLIFNA